MYFHGRSKRTCELMWDLRQKAVCELSHLEGPCKDEMKGGASPWHDAHGSQSFHISALSPRFHDQENGRLLKAGSQALLIHCAWLRAALMEPPAPLTGLRLCSHRSRLGPHA